MNGRKAMIKTDPIVSGNNYNDEGQQCESFSSFLKPFIPPFKTYKKWKAAFSLPVRYRKKTQEKRKPEKKRKVSSLRK